MRTFRKITISITAAMLFAVAPSAQAQEIENLELMQTFLAIMTDYFEIIESTHDIASDPEKAAIMQMQKIQEAYEERGEKARVAEVLRDVLQDSRSTAIRNAAYVKLGDILKETGRTDEAIALLREGLSENINASN